MKMRIILEECIGFRVENGFIVVYKGMQKLFKISKNKKNIENLSKLMEQWG